MISIDLPVDEFINKAHVMMTPIKIDSDASPIRPSSGYSLHPSPSYTI